MARARKRSSIFFPWERGGKLFGAGSVGRRVWMGLLAALVLGAAAKLFMVADRRAKTRATHVAAASVRDAVGLFRIDLQRCPRSMRELMRPPNDEVYLTATPADGWGKPFTVRCPGHGAPADVISAGPDGSFDGLDDLD